MKPVHSLFAAGLLAISLLTGCSSPTDGQTPSAPATDGTATSAAGTQAPADASPARVVQVDTGTVIATQEYTVPGTKDKVTVGLQSLVVDEKTMVLQLVLTPDFTSVSDSSDISVFKMFGETSPRPKLVDRDNLKEYSLISAPGLNWSADSVYTKTTNHEPVIWWGVYAAPQDNNETFDVRVADALAEFTDVPVTR
ncbi:hypothetical protein GCM10009715_36230 [Paeniglutamicibacter psychrophenolicus]|uniref:DUF4352 domain-containing protein n=1 Tax=Paeniglutamicibacter psychrophenolicus TaxID=257454 RepID=A0ABS4WC71_9MICC|nr:hypothetical protein [Paeniglutamicibacter psychrophenolicus]MBP2373209.1 hypothetical protein [Paeniglutamicibacter psychrophenolicus]